jgi:hypothetical protein
VTVPTIERDDLAGALARSTVTAVDAYPHMPFRNGIFPARSTS